MILVRSLVVPRMLFYENEKKNERKTRKVADLVWQQLIFVPKQMNFTEHFRPPLPPLDKQKINYFTKIKTIECLAGDSLLNSTV